MAYTHARPLVHDDARRPCEFRERINRLASRGIISLFWVEMKCCHIDANGKAVRYWPHTGKWRDVKGPNEGTSFKGLVNYLGVKE